MGILDGLINPDDQKYALLGALGSGLLGATTGRNPMQSIARGLGAGVSGLYGGIQAAQGQQHKLLENQRLQQLIDSQIAAGNRQAQMDQWSQMKDLYQMRRDQGADQRAEQKAVAEQAKAARETEEAGQKEAGQTAFGMLLGKDYDQKYRYPDGTSIADALKGSVGQNAPSLAEKLIGNASDRPYKIGQEITRDEGRNKVTYRVDGYDEGGMPILKRLAVGDKGREDVNQGKVFPTGYIDPNTGIPLVIDRNGNMRPANTGGIQPSIKPSNETADKEAQLNVMKEGVNRIRQSWKPEYTGAGQSLMGKAGEWIGTTPEEQTSFYGDLQSVRDALLRAKSGAQINEQEYRRLKSIIPDEYKADRTFGARLERFEKELNDIIEGRRKSKMGLGTAPSGGNATSSGNRFTIREVK